MEERGLVGTKDGTSGKSAKEARGVVGKSSGKEGSVEGVGKRKEEGGKGGDGLKAGKEKEKRKEKYTTTIVSSGKGAEGNTPDVDGGGAPPTDKGTKKQKSKERKTKNKNEKEGEELVEGKRSTKDTPSSEYIGEHLLLIEAEPHKKLLVDLNSGDPWTVQVRAACLFP